MSPNKLQGWLAQHLSPLQFRPESPVWETKHGELKLIKTMRGAIHLYSSTVEREAGGLVVRDQPELHSKPKSEKEQGVGVWSSGQVLARLACYGPGFDRQHRKIDKQIRTD